MVAREIIRGLISCKRIVGAARPPKAGLITQVNLRSHCSPVENQQSIGSCTAHAGVGMVEYYERRAFGRHIDASRLFLYKVTRNLLGWTGGPPRPPLRPLDAKARAEVMRGLREAGVSLVVRPLDPGDHRQVRSDR